MKQIADAAEVSVSNIYHYFENKEQLFYAVVDPVYYQLDQLIGSFHEDETGNRIDEHIAEYLKQMDQNDTSEPDAKRLTPEQNR